MGVQVIQRTPQIVAYYWTGLALVIGSFTLAIVKYDWLAAGWFITCILSAIFGFLLGCAQGLAIAPFFILTYLDTGVQIRFTRRREFNCMYKCKHWAKMHIRDEILIVFVDEEYKMISLLKGLPPAAVNI